MRFDPSSPRPACAFVGASLSAVLSAAALAGGPTWENLMTADGTQPVPGIKGAVWVPNQFNNPTIDSSGRIYFRGQFAGPGITTANSRVIMAGEPGAWSIIAREGSPLPGGFIPGAVINTSSGINGLSSANMITANGGVIVAGSANGGGVTSANNDFNVFVSSSGTASMIARESDAYPGAAGVTMTVAQLSSGTYCNNQGAAITAVTLAGTGVITAAGATQNNAAVVLYSPSGTIPIIRRGDAAPGAGAGDYWNVPAGAVFQQNSFGLFLNGNHYAFSGKLVHPTSGVIPAETDDVYLTNVGAPAGTLRYVARDGSEIPGFPGVFFKQASAAAGPISWGNHPVLTDGAIVFYSILGGAVTTGVDDVAVMLWENGSYSMLLRRGESIPGITDGTVLSGPNTSAFIMNQNRLLCYQGILMNPDGTPAASNATFVGYRKVDGTKGVILRQGDAVPGSKGATVGSLNGSTSICISDSDVCVFTASVSGGAFGAFGSIICAWDESNGLRILAKTGDTNFTGTPVNQITLIGSTGVNGNGGNSGINPSGELVLRAADTSSAIYTIARIDLGAAPCTGDFNGDGIVSAEDLAVLLAGWGGPEGDLNGDGVTSAEDLSILLGAWGVCQ